jgi:hypothetical protein
LALFHVAAQHGVDAPLIAGAFGLEEADQVFVESNGDRLLFCRRSNHRRSIIAQASAFDVHAFAKAVIASVMAAAAARIDRIAGSAFMFVSSFVYEFLFCSDCGP